MALLSQADVEAEPAWREAVDIVVGVGSGSIGGYNAHAAEMGRRIGELHSDMAAEFGIVAGAVGGAVEKLVDFATDVTLGFPFLIYAIALSALFPLEAPRALLLTLVIGMFGWPGIARVVAAETRVIVKQPYVVASRAMGARFGHLFRHQVLPNVASTVIVFSCISLPGRIAAEATLSFLGVGMLPPTPSWGRSIGDAINWLLVDPAFLLFPAAALFLVTFSFTILGDTLRDALDPRGGRP